MLQKQLTFVTPYHRKKGLKTLFLLIQKPNEQGK